jgi:hypothetical protein
MVEEGLVVLSDVDIIKYSYRAFEVNEDKLPAQSGENSV